MVRLLYRVYRIVSAARYWLARRLTPAGWMVLIGMLLTAGLGVDIQQAMAYQAFALLTALMATAIAASITFRGRFKVERRLPRFGTVGQPMVYTAVVRNLSKQLQAGLVLIEELVDPRPGLEEFRRLLRPARRTRSFSLEASRIDVRQAELRPQPLPSLLPGTETEVRVDMLPLKRGALRFTAAIIGRADPLGLFRAILREPLPQSVLILPKRYYVPPIALPGTLQYQQGGVTMASSVGRSDEFVSLREYRRGDPMRHIHWRSWARAGRPIVKEFQDEFFARHALILDTFTAPDRGAVFEEAVSVAASFACTLESQESLLDLLFVGPHAYCFTAGRGVAHTDQMLEVLASVQICSNRPFAELRRHVVDHAAAVSGCICVFVDWDTQRQELVRELKSLRIPVKVLVLREPDGPGELDPGPMRDAPEELKLVRIDDVARTLSSL